VIHGRPVRQGVTLLWPPTCVDVDATNVGFN